MTENVAELPKAYEISYVNCKTLNHSSILQQWKITIFFTSMEKQSDKFSVVVIVHSLSWVWHFVTPWTAAHQVSLSFTFSQTHVHWVGDATQPSHPLLPSSPPALNLSQHQGLFLWVNSASGGQNIGALASASDSFQWLFSVDFL